MPEGTVTMERDDAALDELMTDISCDIEQNVDPLMLFNGDNADEARLAALTSAVENVAEHVGDGILSHHVDRDLLDTELSEIVAVCGVVGADHRANNQRDHRRHQMGRARSQTVLLRYCGSPVAYAGHLFSRRCCRNAVNQSVVRA